MKNAARDQNTSELKATQLEAQTHAWTYCPLSQKPLTEPIVSDSGGLLYNKDAVIEYLLPSEDAQEVTAKSDREEVTGCKIKGLRDIIEVKFEVEKSAPNKAPRRICPITSKELGPSTKAVYLVPCGHAFSESAFKEINQTKSAEKAVEGKGAVEDDLCLTCNTPYKNENVIPILPTAKEDINRLASRALNLKEAGLTHSLKKAPGGSKKRKKHATEATSVPELIDTSAFGKSHTAIEEEKPRPANGVSRSGTSTPSGVSSGIKNSATASLTAKVLQEQEERNKRRKLGLNDNLKSLFSDKGSNGSTQKGGDFMTRGYSLPSKR